jgi:ABC-type multidrug transport system ATPase subunit
MKEVVLQTERLTKKYGGKRAVEEVTLCVYRGEVYGFLGPNGAGKTTVMLLLLGLLVPTGGTITLLGELFGGNRPWVRRRIGAVPEKPYIYPEMTAVEYLKFFADLYEVDHPMKRAYVMLEKLGLLEAARKRLGTFSRGMQQKVHIARALLHDPELLLLDEPVSGLDPHGIREVRNLIEEFKTGGRTVFISSHLLSEVERVCDRMAIMSDGNLLVEETMAGIRKKLSRETTVEVEVNGPEEQILGAVSNLPFVREVFRTGNVISLKVESEDHLREKISRTVTEAGGTVLSVSMRELSLEDAFLTLTTQNVSLFTGSKI